ncbi:PQQ-binding-like beta-propeller repeat protein [archaeon]|nr:PQQ-binding-like beta-propeller repeat protein [archaeon]
MKRWTKTFERPGSDYPFAVLQTSEGGYVVSGRTNNGTKDCYGGTPVILTFLLKTDADGNKLWEKFHYAGRIVSIKQTSDGGLVATGSIAAPDTGIDIYLVKTDAEGNVAWEKNYGESDPEEGFSAQQTSDGGYIVAGGTGRHLGNQGIYLLKVDSNGNKLWSKIFAKDLKTDEQPRLVQQTADGGYIVVGWRKSQGTPSADENDNDKYIDDDVYLLKTDADGNKILEKTIDAFGQHADDKVVDAKQTSDGGIIIVGGSTPIVRSNGALQSSSPHAYLLKIDSDGNNAWAKDFGFGIGHSVQQNSGGGYIITAEAMDMVGPNYLVKIGTDSDGNKLWEKPIDIFNTYQGRDYLDVVKQTSDGGYVVLGTREYGDLMGYAGMLESDTLLMKIDETDRLRLPAYEQVSRETRLSTATEVEQLTVTGKGWAKMFGGNLSNRGYSVQQTSDGGYILAGMINYGVTAPSGLNETTILGQYDVYLVKTDANGNKVWEKSYGGNRFEGGLSVQQTSDGGYIVLGIKEDLAYLIKTDAYGNMLWDKALGENYGDMGFSLLQTSDSGYIIVGTTQSHGATPCSVKEPEKGTSADVYVIKTDADGNKLWEKAIGGPRLDVGYSVQQTSDGNYIITGMTTSFSERGVEDVYLLEIDTNGNKLWEKAIGGNKSEIGYSVQQTDDGGYIIVGQTVYTLKAGDGGYARQSDVYLIKTDANGNIIWEKTFGGNMMDRGYSVQQTSDSGYIITGDTDGYLYLFKTDANGNKIWEKAFKRDETKPFTGRSVKQTSDGGYIVVANTFYTSTPVYQPIYLIKTDANGNV